MDIMANFYENSSTLSFDGILDIPSDTTFDITCVFYGILLILVSTTLYVSPSIYHRIRRHFSVRVNCWFCNNYTSVPYDLSNSWNCPYCEQYNGFNKDGGYNKIIKEQFYFKGKENRPNILKTTSNNKLPVSNGFCKFCNINQHLKVQQLALFVPLDEKNFDEEIEVYRQKLENVYKLCPKCEEVLQGTLEKQNYNLLKNRLNVHKNTPISNTSNRRAIFNIFSSKQNYKINTFLLSLLRAVCVLLNILLLFAIVFHLGAEYDFTSTVPFDFVILEPTLGVCSEYLQKVYHSSRELSFAGLCCCILSHLANHRQGWRTSLIFWGLLHILFWSDLKTFQAVTCVLSLLFSSGIIPSKRIYLSKKTLAKKSGFQPEKLVFSKDSGCDLPFPDDRWTFSPVVGKEKLNVGMEPLNFSELKVNQSKDCHSRGNVEAEPKLKKKENEKECELPSVIDLKKNGNKREDTMAGSKRNALFCEKPNFGNSENENNGRNANESFESVYSNLSGLNLGRKQNKVKKSSNFLFENHNFSEKRSSIIKPAKFIKNLSNSWTCQELNESSSRSSTPSVVYSSPKTERMDGNRYDFTKTMSPITINPHIRPRDCFEYYDGNNSFYNNFNCFAPGFVPFQTVPSPVGHTTVYTYTRPTNVSFPFSPQPFSGYKFSPGFSDGSDRTNLFQNLSKSVENKRRWPKLKTISYVMSIFLNFITLLCIIYFLCAGVISVDWGLPKINFFF